MGCGCFPSSCAEGSAAADGATLYWCVPSTPAERERFHLLFTHLFFIFLLTIKKKKHLHQDVTCFLVVVFLSNGLVKFAVFLQ